MKRRIALTLIVTAAVLATGCGERPAPAAEQTPARDGWVMPPIIDAVEAGRGDLGVSGQASPLGRVVVSGPGGQAYAAGADEDGRFELRIPRPAHDALFVVEARVGQLGYPAPYRLLVAADPAGPIALLTVGAPTRRLDPAGAGVDAIDSDGRATFVSGRAAPGADIEVEVGGVRTVTATPDGRWSLAAPGNGSSPVRVGGVELAPPGGEAAADGVLERAGAGWRFSWSIPGGARQTTWFPGEAS
jgi:hypothetical protein